MRQRPSKQMRKKKSSKLRLRRTYNKKLKAKKEGEVGSIFGAGSKNNVGYNDS
jgi:hypothetical protein